MAGALNLLFMEPTELTLEHLLAYLEHEVLTTNSSKPELKRFYALNYMEGIGSISHLLRSQIYQMVLYPLSDYKDINSEAMNELGWDMHTQIELSDLAHGFITVDDLHYSTFKYCCEEHIDIFNLIPAGLAIAKERLAKK